MEHHRPWTYPQSTVAVVNDGHTAIVVDDHCYCLMNWIPIGQLDAERHEWRYSAWIFREAIEALRKLPLDPDQATIIYGL